MRCEPSLSHRTDTRMSRKNKIGAGALPQTLAPFFPFLGRNSPTRERAARATGHGTTPRICSSVRSPEGERAVVKPVHDDALKRLWGVLNSDLRLEVPQRPSSRSQIRRWLVQQRPTT
jgi:hypothetical protein